MIPESKGLIYSYKDFDQSDFELTTSDIDFDQDEIFNVDYIDFTDLTAGEQQGFVFDNYNKYKKDIKTDYRFRNKYFFKDFVVRYPSNNEDSTIINRYTLSGWNAASKRKGIDDRTLTLDLFSYVEEVDTLYRDYRFLVKTEHIYQLLQDINRYMTFVEGELIGKEDLGNQYAIDEEINLYLLPIYIYSKKLDKYTRISDYIYGKRTYATLSDILVDLYESLKLFASVNFYMLDMYNSNDRVTVYNTNTRRFSNLTFKAYSAVATNNKKVYAYIDKKMPNNYSPSLEININSDRSNILAGTDIPRKLCDYRYTVRGHKSHRWVGKKGNQHLEEIWIDPYEKNKDKAWKIIKETKMR